MIEFKVDGINKFKLIKDLLMFRIKYKEFKSVNNILTLLNKFQDKTITVRDISKFKFSDLKRSVDLYNKYVIGTKIDFQLLITAMRQIQRD